MGILLSIIALFSIDCFMTNSWKIESFNQANQSREIGYKGLDRHVYKGDYSTGLYYGESEYLYINKSDESRVYDGRFFFQGLSKHGDYYDSMNGRIMGTITKEEKSYLEKTRKLGLKTDKKKRIRVEGEFVNGLKNGRWITVAEEYNLIKGKYVPVDSCLFNYDNGYLDGEQYYVHYNIVGLLIKKEIVEFVSNKVLKATVYHHGYRCEKYDSFYNEKNEPSGVWMEKRDNGVYYLDFDKGRAYFKNSQTGFVEAEMKIAGAGLNRSEVNIAQYPFEHGFWEFYDRRTGAFGVGDYNSGDNYKGYRTRVINQIDD